MDPDAKIEPAALTPTDQYAAAVVIPTVANPDVLLPSFERLLRFHDGLPIVVVVSVNPLDAEHAKQSIKGVIDLWEAYEQEGRLDGCDLVLLDMGSPRGFGGAINDAVNVLLDPGHVEFMGGDVVRDTRVWRDEPAMGLPPLVNLYNDDLVAVEGWLSGQIAALGSETVEDWAEVPDADTLRRPNRSMEDYGIVGMVGPVTTAAAGLQGIMAEGDKVAAMGHDAFAKAWRKDRNGRVVSAAFLSGFCLTLTRELVCQLVAGQDVTLPVALMDERYEIAGYEDNDLAARADRAGYRAIIAADTYIGHLGHQTFDASFPEMERGMRNRLTYYDVWRPRLAVEGRKVCAVYRVRIDVPYDLVVWRLSLAKMGSLVDAVAVVITNNPGDAVRTRAFQGGECQNPHDRELLLQCERDPSGVARHVRRWIRRQVGLRPDARPVAVKVDRWSGEFNERDERNHAFSIAEGLGADWALSVDHDEVMEDRITRAHLERLMRHPDPLVGQWDIGFCNHWDSDRLCNQTPPWGDGGRYTGGMRGYRFVRLNKAAPRRILGGTEHGLHCGNTPQAGAYPKRVAGLRYRHFGYLRHEDRVRKRRRYDEQDPEPNPLLIGGKTYGHIEHEELQLMSPFIADDGVGLHMLMYDGETADDLGRVMDRMYGLVDRVVLVWTGEWSPDDRAALFARAAPYKRPDGSTGTTWVHDASMWDVEGHRWPSTGPSRAVARMAAHYGCEWVHKPLADDLGAARNEGLDALWASVDVGMGWALFLDPDEHLPTQAYPAIRRMAEASDAWGWEFQFVNVYKNADGQVYNASESVRMSRLDPQRYMRLKGRVHETFGDAVRLLTQDLGLANPVRRAPFSVMNTGTSGTAAEMDAKFEFYKRLAELELHENPYTPQSWLTLALYWENEGCDRAAEECFNRAMMCRGAGHVVYMQAAYHYLRIAQVFAQGAANRVDGKSARARHVHDVAEALGQIAEPFNRTGLVAIGEREPADDSEALASLPPFDIDVALGNS